MRILPIAIMACNEERVITRAVENCLRQLLPAGFSVRVIVVANGCTDRTESLVSAMARRHPGQVVLLSMKEKGKTIALNRAISYFRDDAGSEAHIPYVVFMDADCELVGHEALVRFVGRFEEVPSLAAVGALNVPKTEGRACGRHVAEMYRATDDLNRLLPENAISGGAYCIRLDVLKKLRFPDFQMADDLFVSFKLDGWMFRDSDIRVEYAIPESLGGELRKRIRQEIATRRFYEYCRNVMGNAGDGALFEHSPDDRYRWTGFTPSDVMATLPLVKGFRKKLLISLSILIRLLAKVAASWKMRKLEKAPQLDYWQVER